jgi:rare lipoprotein A (peptidoglycan hydrolase)
VFTRPRVVRTRLARGEPKRPCCVNHHMKPCDLPGLIGVMLLWAPLSFAAPPPNSPAAKQEAEKLAQLPPVKPHSGVDHSGRKQEGRGSYYAKHFTNRKMANGQKFDPNGHVAASKTLPLGTTAKVTNVQKGKSTMVKVEDRGPHANGRIIDVAPKAADELDLKKQGVAPRARRTGCCAAAKW